MKVRACRRCSGDVFKTPGPGRWPHFCSEDCRRAMQREDRGDAPVKHGVCAREACRSPFTFQHGRPRKFCSPECRGLDNYERARQDGRYEQWRDTQRAKDAEERASRPVRTCEFCPQPITSHHPLAKTCGGVDCKAKNNAQRALRTQRRLIAEFAARGESYRGQWGRKRYSPTGRRRGGGGDPVDRDTVGERDGWVCGICQRPVNRHLRYPDPMSPSLDHTVPLGPKHGGAHTWDNVRIAHNDCNVRRKDRVDWTPEVGQ